MFPIRLSYLFLRLYNHFYHIGDESKQKRMCQLRRFQDGTIKETVTIKISSWGAYANDFILDKIVHLVSVHFNNVEAQVLRGKKLQTILVSHINR